MIYNPSEDYDDTSSGETNNTDETARTQDDDTTDTQADKNAPDELSKPNVNPRNENEPVGDSD